MDLNAAKWAALVGLLIITLFLSMLPLWLLWSVRHTIDQARKARFVGKVFCRALTFTPTTFNINFICRYSRVISLLSCFAGGVFMATGLLHLFPEVDEALSKVKITFRFFLMGVSPVNFLLLSFHLPSIFTGIVGAWIPCCWFFDCFWIFPCPYHGANCVGLQRNCKHQSTVSRSMFF